MQSSTAQLQAGWSQNCLIRGAGIGSVFPLLQEYHLIKRGEYSLPSEGLQQHHYKRKAKLNLHRTDCSCLHPENCWQKQPKEKGSISLEAAPCPHQDEAQLVVPLHRTLHNIPGCSTQLVPLTCKKSHIVFQHQSGNTTSHKVEDRQIML